MALLRNEIIEVKIHRMTLEELVWQRVRRRSPDLTTEVLGLNPGIAALGHYLPLGTKITMPIYDQRKEAKQPVRLWD